MCETTKEDSYNSIPGAAFCCRFDKDWTVLTSNDELYAFLGYSREEFHEMGNRMSAVIYPPDLEIMMDKVTKQLENGNTSVRNENRLICKDGTIKWISIMGQLLCDENGEKYFYCIFGDISKQKVEEQRAMVARKNLSVAMEHAKMLYWEYDFASNVAHTNALTTEFFGTPRVIEDYPESFLSLGFVAEDDCEAYRKVIGDIRNGKEYAELVTKMRTIRNEYVWMKLRFTTICDESGQPVRAVCTAETVTEYKELEQRFQTTLQQSSIDCWTYDISKKRIILPNTSHALSRYAGKKVIEDVPESQIRDKVCHPDDAEYLREVYGRLDNGEKEATATIRFWDDEKQGYRWKQCSFTVVSDSDNLSLYAVGSAVDITEQKEAQRQYEMAVEYREHTQPENQLFSAHCSLTQNRILEISDGMGKELLNKFSDVRDDFVLGLGTLMENEQERQVFYRRFRNEGAKHHYELGDTQMSMECEITLQEGKYKEHKWVQIQMAMVIEPVNKELEGFVTLVDLSESKRQENILAAALQWDYDFVASLDLETEKMHIFRHNPEEQNLEIDKYGVTYRYSERFKKVAEEYVIEEDKQLYVDSMSVGNIIEQLKNAEVYEFTYHMCEKSGDIRAKRARFSAYQSNRRNVVFSRTDVTDILAEQEEQKKILSNLLVEAEKANKAKSDFLSRVSHDMRTPLNGILGLTKLMRDKTDWSEIQEDITQLELSGRYLLNLINDTLDVSKIESGKMVLQPSVCEGKTLFLSIMNLLKPSVEAKQIDVKVNVGEIPFTILYVDVGRIQQLILNLLSNAIKFTPEKGTIWFEMKNIENNERELVDQIIIADTGIGIKKEFLPHLFEPFSQENTERTSQYQGTGLGMTISKQIVEMMGGTISVESEVNKGTKFTFTIHLQKATESQIAQWQKETPKKADLSVLKGKRILMCEDHPLNAQIAERLLEKMDVKVELATNGQEGLKMFEESSESYYDVVLMDVRMPVMDGLEATRAFRKLDREDAKKIPIIAMTANAFHEDIEECKQAGMNAHIAKPLDPQLMYDVIARYLTEKTVG